MFHPVQSAAAKTATAIAVVALSAVGLAGTAQAATVSGARVASAVSGGRYDAPPPPRRFRQRFHTQAQCIAFAQHDHNPRTNGWDCRQGTDRTMPWEYWF